MIGYVAQDLTFWRERLDSTKELLTAVDAAVLHFATNNAEQEYRLNTGQTDMRVRRADLAQVRAWRERLLVEVEVLEAKVHGCGSIRIRPAW